MKKNLLLAAALSCVVIFIACSPPSCGCSKKKQGSIFADPGPSPLRREGLTSGVGEIQTVFGRIYELYKDRVVFITTEQTVKMSSPFMDDPFFREFFGDGGAPMVQRRRGFGTGFILSEDGYVCTNHHVIAGVDTVTVKIDSRIFKASVVGSDERTDIALLKIETKHKLKPVFLGDSDTVKVGDWAIAIGNPFGLDRTFTVGVVSAINRKDLDIMGGPHIQTDASINPGNSGGPLINIYGEVIGINRLIYSGSGGNVGIGFSIPVNTVKTILEQLKLHRKVVRGFIGVNLAPVTPDIASRIGLASAEGALVTGVIGGGPAEAAGLAAGDVILLINDRKISNMRDLMTAVGGSPVGSSIKVTVWRRGGKMNVYVKIAERQR